MTRRKFIALLAVSVGRSAIAAEPLGDDLLAARLPAKVREREALQDAVTRFRLGGGAKIDGAVEQLLQIMQQAGDSPKPRLLALRWALSQYLDAESRLSYAFDSEGQRWGGSVSAFGVGKYKCNKLVADAYAVGAQLGLSVGEDWESNGVGKGWPAIRYGEFLWPPVSHDLARVETNIRSLTNARKLRQEGEPKAQPELGDLIAFPAEREFGHVGLYLGKNLIVSAKETGIEIGPIEAEEAAHNDIVRIRKFTGTGQ